MVTTDTDHADQQEQPDESTHFVPYSCKKRFQVKMFDLFLSYYILYVLHHILSCPSGFLDLENVS